MKIVHLAKSFKQCHVKFNLKAGLNCQSSDNLGILASGAIY